MGGPSTKECSILDFRVRVGLRRRQSLFQALLQKRLRQKYEEEKEKKRTRLLFGDISSLYTMFQHPPPQPLMSNMFL